MKGGVGKTTLAVNLAWYMHSKGYNVLLVDLDPQFNATQYVMGYKEYDLHRKSKGTIVDLLIDKPKLELAVRSAQKRTKDSICTIRTTNRKKFDLLPAELDLAWIVKNPAQMDFRLEKLLSEVRESYDYIFIDCAPTDSVLTTMALSASNYLLVPMRPDRFSILGYLNLIRTVETFRRNCLDSHKVKDLGVVFTQVMGTSGVEDECIAEISSIAKKEDGYVFNSQFKHSLSFIRAVQDQTPIFETLYTRQDVKDAASQVAAELQTRIALLK